MRMATMRMDRFTGLLLGTAVGDSLGLPTEGLTPRRARRLYPGALRQRLIGSYGMLSDDTEHACMTAHAEDSDPDRFARVLASKLRCWLFALPPAIGFGTLRALLRLCAGFSPARSGVRSAGNGAVMRAPIIGAWFDDPERIPRFVAGATAITHRDPRAHAGATAIAIAAHHAVRDRDIEAGVVLEGVRVRIDDRELLDALDRVETALVKQDAPVELAAEPTVETSTSPSGSVRTSRASGSPSRDRATGSTPPDHGGVRGSLDGARDFALPARSAGSCVRSREAAPPLRAAPTTSR